MKKFLIVLAACFLLCACKAEPIQTSSAVSESVLSIEESVVSEESVLTAESVVSEVSEVSEVPEESEQSLPDEESAPTINPNTGREPIVAVYEDKPRHIAIEIYQESTREMIHSIEITDRKECNDLYYQFNLAFADACNEYPAHNAESDDMFYQAEYRVLVRYTTYADEEKTTVDLCAEVTYPHGYSNEIYGIVHFDPFCEYSIGNGKNFIDLIDNYVKQFLSE